MLESDVLLASLPGEPQLRPELVLLQKRMAREPHLHLILDMARVEIITSPSLGRLLLLRRFLAERQRRLLLCNPRLATRCIFRVAGLDGFFEYVRDQTEALKAVRQSVCASTADG
jgi:anti-anti-sigma regulatory factor